MFGLTGIMRYLVPGLAVLALIAAIVFGVRGCKQDDRDATNQSINIGEVREREAGQSKVLNDVQESRNAVEHPTDADSRNVCEKYDRNCPDR